ncbi:MAG: methyltransferase domain-containing protein [bacterium]
MLKQMIKGIITCVPGAYRTLFRNYTGGTESARYCYSVWLRHLVLARDNGFMVDPKVVAEIGPGDSLGIGLAALISGVEKYFAFDIVDYTSAERNLTIFDELVALFEQRADIPDDQEFPEVEPRLSTYRFPADILTEARLDTALASQRLERLRRSIRELGVGDDTIQYKVPWYDVQVVKANSVDMILSQAALEHVDELQLAYENMYSWLRPGGFVSHAIDFRSHGSANDWNGHWTYSDLVWKLITGRRPYLINRQPHSRHLALLAQAGFEVTTDAVQHSPSRFTLPDLAPRFRRLQPEDLVTSTAFIQARKQLANAAQAGGKSVRVSTT